ncbi:MAG: tripartite tricarboxylate transporter permease [Desulfosudis oleivorans]|nr:tripartite tricarboxylate transporter permease [Desulfosudis oleivorans]
MEQISGLLYGFSVALTWSNSSFLLSRGPRGNPRGGPARASARRPPWRSSCPSPSSSSPSVRPSSCWPGIFYGAMYGGSTTSILLNIPGRGRLGRHLPRRLPDGPARAGPAPALAIAAIGSFIAGTVGVIGLNFLAPPSRRVRRAVRAPGVLHADPVRAFPGRLPGLDLAWSRA